MQNNYCKLLGFVFSGIAPFLMDLNTEGISLFLTLVLHMQHVFDIFVFYLMMTSTLVMILCLHRDLKTYLSEYVY